MTFDQQPTMPAAQQPAPAVLPNGLPVMRARLRAGEAFLITLGLIVNLAAIGGFGWVALNQQRVADQFAVWQFTPSVALSGYTERDTFTDEGRFLFFASRPVIAAEGEFDDVCSNNLEDVGILGCYLPGDKTIYLYDVTDDRLDGLEEVVAAHEMLHAAWDRMSSAQRDELAPLLEAEAAKHADEPAFAETLAFYAQTEPGERLNELHSIIGTEFGDVSSELEAHYATYFGDRGAVVALHDKSNAVFEQQAAAVDALATQIDQLAASINADYDAYNAGYDQLNADIDAFNSRADAGDFSSQAQFDSERDALLNRQADLDANYSAIEARVTQYDGLVAQLDALNAAVAQLNEAINITPHAGSGASG